MFFYARQPLTAELHGTVNMESLLINVNASIIRSISRIASQLTKETTAAAAAAAEPASGKSTVAVDRTTTTDLSARENAESFWAIKTFTPADLPQNKDACDGELEPLGSGALPKLDSWGKNL